MTDPNSRTETQPALPPGSASQPTSVESSSFNTQISRSARDLLPDEVKASGFMTAQSDSSPPKDSTTPDPSNPAEPTEPDTKVGKFTQALYDEAKKDGWVVISMKDDWKRIFGFEP